jgi:hypothetical protein
LLKRTGDAESTPIFAKLLNEPAFTIGGHSAALALE